MLKQPQARVVRCFFFPGQSPKLIALAICRSWTNERALIRGREARTAIGAPGPKHNGQYNRIGYILPHRGVPPRAEEDGVEALELLDCPGGGIYLVNGGLNRGGQKG